MKGSKTFKSDDFIFIFIIPLVWAPSLLPVVWGVCTLSVYPTFAGCHSFSDNSREDM